MGQLKEIEAQGRELGETSMQHSEDDLNKLIQVGKLPKELGRWYIEYFDKQDRLFKEWQTFSGNNSDMPENERMERFYGLPRESSFEETIEHFEEFIKLGQIHNILWANKLAGSLEQDETQSFTTQFFQTIGTDEFGMARLFADPLNNVNKMLEKVPAPQKINDDSYVIQAECKNSTGDDIRLEYRFRASNQEEANLQSQKYILRLVGRQKKIHQACWALANKKHSRIVTCDLTELMMVTYPDRKNKNSFSVDQKLEFFQDLFDLGQTILILKKAPKKNQKKNRDAIDTFLLPFITIHKTSDYNITSGKKSERYPNNISFSVLHNPLYASETMYNVGAGIKHKTLELHPDDSALAEYLQIRKSQSQDQNKIIFTHRNDLMKLANLDGIKHSGMANKKLLDKFGRLKEKGIILSFSSKVVFPFFVKIR